MPPTQRKFMLCSGECVPAEKLAEYPGSHIIGELCYLSDEGRKVTALKYYEKSTSGMPGEHPHTLAYLIGDARRIRCRFRGCNRKVRWEAGTAARNVIVERVIQQRHKYDESA